MKYLFLLFTLLLVSRAANAQKSFSGEFIYKATYELTYQPDSTDRESVQSEQMLLYLGDRISRFSSLGTAVGDSLIANRDRSNKSMAAFARLRSQIPESEFKYYVYKGIPTGHLSFTTDFGKDSFRYVEALKLIDWQVLPETKGIAGYRAQKATGNFGGRNYTAWFTSEIPIPDGPYKFSGLPGLIVKVTDGKNHYSFVLRRFEALKEPVGFEFSTRDYIRMKKQKFLNIMEENERDPFAVFERQGITLKFQPGQKEKLLRERRKRLRKENNPIELK